MPNNSGVFNSKNSLPLIGGHSPKARSLSTQSPIGRNIVSSSANYYDYAKKKPLSKINVN